MAEREQRPRPEAGPRQAEERERAWAPQPRDGPRVDPDDAVEEASYESFPASDPPGYAPSKIG